MATSSEEEHNSAWQRTCESLKEHYQEFAGETPIDTFVIVSKAKFLLEIIGWAVITLVLTGATLWNVKRTIESYTSYTTISKISVASQPYIKYDDISVCFVRNTRTAEETVTSTSQLTFPRNSTAFVDDLLYEQRRLQNVTDNFANNCKTAGCWTSDYDKLLLQLNTSLLSDGQLQFAWLIARLFNEVENNFYSTEADLEPLNRLINDYKYLWLTINVQIPISQFRKLVASIICYRMAIFSASRSHHFRNRTKYNSFKVKNPCSIENIWWSGITINDNETEFICVRSHSRHWLNFHRNVTKQAYLIYTIPKYLNFSNSAFDEVQLLFDNNLNPTLGDPNVLLLQQSASTVVLIEHVGSYKNYVASGKCTPTTTSSVCAGNDTENLFLSHCNCSSTSWNWTTNQTSVCSMENYFDILENITTAKQCVKDVYSKYSDMERSCRPQCDYNIYRFDVQHSDQNFLTLNGATVVELKPKSFVLHNVEEVLFMDFDKFLSELGGCLSLWINASFVGILHAAAFVIRKCYVCLRGTCRHNIRKFKNQNRSVSVLVESANNVDVTSMGSGKTKKKNSKLGDRSVSIIEVNDRRGNISNSHLTKRNRSHLSK